MHRKMLLGLAATMFSVVGLGAGVGSSAAFATVNHFKGGAPGSVTCLFQLNIHFKRAIHPADGALTYTEKMAGHASSCTTDESANPGITTTVHSAAIPGVWTAPSAGIIPDGTQYTCGVSFGSTGQVSSGWTFKWQQATYYGNGFSGSAQFFSTTVSPITGAVSGNQITLNGMTQTGGVNAPLSFQGTVTGTLTQSAPATPIATLCSRNALGSVQFTGYITIGG